MQDPNSKPGVTQSEKEYKIKTSNPTQDEIRKMLDHCKGVFNGSTDVALAAYRA